MWLGLAQKGDDCLLSIRHESHPHPHRRRRGLHGLRSSSWSLKAAPGRPSVAQSRATTRTSGLQQRNCRSTTGAPVATGPAMSTTYLQCSAQWSGTQVQSRNAIHPYTT